MNKASLSISLSTLSTLLTLSTKKEKAPTKGRPSYLRVSRTIYFFPTSVGGTADGTRLLMAV